MIVPIFFYAKCDPTFQHKVIDPLEKEITEIKEMPGDEFTVQKSDLIKAAICKYADWNIIPHDYWDELSTYIWETNDDEWLDIENKALHHFAHAKNPWAYENDPHPAYYYLMNVDRIYSRGCPMEPVHDFPHDSIDIMFYDYQKNVMTQHPTKEMLDKCERMKKLYSQIKAVEEDTEEWFKLLLGVNIDSFLRSNVEHRLHGNLLDKQLWKLYIGYLRDKDPKAMLIVYSKYVRFFMDDKEMLQEYKQQMEEHGHVYLFWKNLLEFEKQSHMLGPDESGDEVMMNSSDDEEMSSIGGEESDISDEEMINTGVDEESDAMDEDILSSSEDEVDDMDVAVAEPPFNPQICATFYNNINPQKAFSLPKPYMDYFLDNAPPSILQKLFKSGKYFFAREPTPICYRLAERGDEIMFTEESVSLNYLDNILLDNIFISTAMRVQWLSNETVDETFKKYTSTLIPHLYRCDAKFIKLDNQHLSFEELKFLIGGGNCIELELPDCEIKDENSNETVDETFKKYTSTLMPHLYRCDAKFIKLDNQHLSFEELKFLIGGGNCIELELPDCEIKDENGEFIDLERIMELLPKITNLELPTVKVNSKTAHALSALKFEDEIEGIKIKNVIGKPFDAEEFKKFIVAKRSQYFKIDLVFDPSFNASFVATLKKLMEEYEKTCDLESITSKIN